ncbi:MAG: porin family protein [Segetibacter sp.]
MKKQILIVAFIAISTLAIAQIKPSFGIRAGLSSAGIQGDAVNSLKNMLDFSNGMVTTGYRTGFFAGSYTTIAFNNMISLEPALYYSQKGYGLKGALNLKGADFLGANAKAQLNSQYIDIPVLLKANFNGFQLFAGPQISYLVQADLHTTAGVLGINLLNRKINATNQFNRWDAGATGGIGYQFTNGINIMAAYDYGLSKADANKSLKSYNRSFKIGVGFGF